MIIKIVITYILYLTYILKFYGCLYNIIYDMEYLINLFIYYILKDP